MSRLDQLEGRGLIARLKAAKTEAENLKRRQFMGGDSIVVKNYQTNNTWDVSTTVAPTDAEKKVRVDFTFDEAGVGYCELEFSWSLNEPDFQNVYGFDDPSTSQSTTKKSFIVGLIPNNNFSSSDTLRLKFGVRSTKSGTLSWTVL